MRRCFAALFVVVAVATLSCTQAAPAPLGEALVVVRTDVAVPRRVNRMRIEIFGSTGRVIERREVVTPSPEDWPVSFSVVLPDGPKEADVLVRLRAYPEGHELSAREIERFAREPRRDAAVHASLEQACRSAPALRLAVPTTLRRGSTRITSLLRVQGCTEETVSGSAVARLEVVEEGDYRVEITRAVPDASRGEPGSDTSISIRTDCALPTTQLACAEQIDDENHLSRIERVTLKPGTYFVVTGGADPAPADLTVVATRLGVIQPIPDDPLPPLTADPAILEPSPGVTIDRLIALRLRAGERGTASIVLYGECFGTPADLESRTTCVDTPGQAVAVTPETTREPLVVDAPPPAPWRGEEPVPCTAAARPEEVCVPGGAFVLGDTLALEDLERRSQPERMRVVEPFFLDRHEMSVGRYRAARAAGFTPPDATPLANEAAPLARDRARGMCTWSEQPLDREAFPLTCVSWVTARALCKFFGGDLPTEDQWELAATSAGREIESPYPWGHELPTCERTVYGRTALPSAQCPSMPLGPLRVDDPLLTSGDVTPLGVVGLAGNVEELLATAFVPYWDPLWTRAGLRQPVDEPEAPLRSARGADWTVGGLYATASTRRSEPVIAAYDNVGFRCARSGR